MIARDQLDHSGDPSTVVRDYILQNWRADVIALVAPGTYDDGTLVEAGRLRERISYDARSLYEGGIPFATHPTDLTHGATGGISGYGAPNGTLNNDDEFYYLSLYGGTNFRADWDRDGDVDVNDYNAYIADKAAASGAWGRGVLPNRNSILGYAGYVHEPATGAAGGGHGTMYHCRLRVHHAGLGRWIQRDPPQYQYREGLNLYWYGADSPVLMGDFLGGACSPLYGCCGVPAFTEPYSNYDPRCDEVCKGSAAGSTTCNPATGGLYCCVCPDNLKPSLSVPPANPPPGTLTQEQVLSLLQQCVENHEQVHMNQGCPPVHPLNITACREEAGYQAEVDCLAALKTLCPPHDCDCHISFNRRITFVNRMLADAKAGCAAAKRATPVSSVRIPF